MKFPWEKTLNRKELNAEIRQLGLLAHILALLGILFALLGFIVEAANITFVLVSTSWFLLAIIVLIIGAYQVFTIAVMRHFRGIEGKGKW